ncbi:MAG: efflux RND transporter periplasmic adaptor subunit, partial [Desulfovibrionaceae bacterium]
EALVQEAAAQLDRTKREWDRIRPLYEKNAVSQKDRDNAKAAYDSAKASLRTAKINLDYCRVVSPVSGFSGKQQFTPGNLVNNNSPLTTVNQTEPLFVNFAIAGPAMMRTQQLMAEGRLQVPAERRYTAKIRLLDGAMYQRDGIVTFVDTQVDPLTGVVKARAEFPNPNGRVLPGQFVRLYMSGAMLINAVLIPQKAVLLTQMGNLVMVVKADNTIEPRPIKISDSVGDMYLVDEGLSGGENIVLEGIIKVRPGQPVRVEEPKAATKAQATKAAGK